MKVLSVLKMRNIRLYKAATSKQITEQICADHIYMPRYDP